MGLLRLANLLDTVRTVDAMFPAQALHVLALVAAEPGITVQSIIDRTGISQPSASRNLTKLGDWPHAARYRGLDLVSCRNDSLEPRRHMHCLTAKGRTFMAKVLTAQTGEHFNARDLP